MAEEVTIRGRVQGSIRARKVLLCSTSHVEGNILHEAFAVETGAFFEGNCRHADNPLADEPSKRVASPAPAAAAPPATAPANAPGFTTVTRSVPAGDARPTAAAATFSPLKSGA